MHIPSEMLSGAVCPVTAAVSLIGVGASAVVSLRRGKAPRAGDFALTGAAVFALQALNYPVWGGISGHLVGGVFASAVLGVPGGVLCMALVLLAQTALFADGGLPMLGANVLNMAVIGAGVGGWLMAWLRGRGFARAPSVALAGAASVMLAALALGAELSACGRASRAVVGTLLGVHLALACVEGAATLGLLALVRPAGEGVALPRRGVAALIALVAAALLLTPFASAFPDAFEWTMGRFALLPEAPGLSAAPFAGYRVPAVPHEALSGALSVAVGAGAVAAAGLALCLPLRRRA